MALTRRQFLKWAGATGIGAVVFNGCTVPDQEVRVQSSLSMPEDLVTGRDNYYATTAQLSSGSEGLLVRVMEGRAKKVEGNPDFPLNTGKHGVRAEGLLQALYHPDRLREPLAKVGKGGPFRRISWAQALARLQEIVGSAESGSMLIATPPTRGALADVVTRFADATGSRAAGFDPLGQQALYRAVSDLFDQQVLPEFDIGNSRYIVSFGADFLGTWLAPTHFMRGYDKFRHVNDHRGYLVQVDSRMSATTAVADEWVYVNPGTEGLLAMAMAHVIISERLDRNGSPDAYTGGGDASRIDNFRPGRVADAIGVPVARIERLARAFASSDYQPAMAIGGGSAGAHTNGTDNLRAILSLNYLVGSAGAPGGIILNPATRNRRIEAASLRDWVSELEQMRSGETKVLLVRDANLLHQLPGELDAAGALSEVETIVSFSSFLDETTNAADLVLPCHTPLEEWGSDTPEPGPGYTTVGFQQPVVRRFRNTLAFGDILLQVGRELEHTEQLPWATMRDAVRAEAGELHAARKGSVRAPTFEEFWKASLERGGWWDQADVVSARPRARSVSRSVRDPSFAGDAHSYPFHLIPFESHGVGMNDAHLPWMQSVPDPLTTVAWQTWVEVNPQTAKHLNIAQQDIVLVEASNGRTIRAPVYINPSTPPSVVAVPFGQGHAQYTSVAAGRGANVFDILVPNEDADTGAFAWASTRVRLHKTNRRQKLASLEGIYPAEQLDDQPIILIHTPGKTSSNGHG